MRSKKTKPSIKMWKPYKKPYRVYSPSALTNAYEAVLIKKLPVTRAAEMYGVPENTLRQRVKGRVNPETTSSGPPPVLSQEEETVFVEHLKTMASLGYGYTVNEVVNMGSNYAVSLKKRDDKHPFSVKWFKSFMRRWPELSVIKPRALSNYRAKATSQTNVSMYFQRLDEVLSKFNLKDKPHCIYNVDEKGIQTEHTPPFVVGTGPSTPAVTSSRSATTTIVGCGNAIGTMMPPFYVFKGQRLRQELLDGAMAGSTGTMSDSGWINSGLFLEFLQTHFIKYIQRNDSSQTILLLFDGHKSHINVTTLEWAKTNNVEMFVLPAHTSHILQPLDVGCFGPLQRIYNSECHRFIRENPSSTITRHNVAQLSSKAYELALSPSNLKSSFKRTGIYPFDPSAIDQTKLLPSTAFEVPQTTTAAVNYEESDFFKEKNEVIAKKRVETTLKQDRNTLSKITSGKSVTDNHVKQLIEEHIERQCKTVKTPGNQNGKRKTQKNLTVPSPVAGPSTVQANVEIDSDYTDTDSEVDDEKCCVCNKFQPDELKRCLSVVFTKWAQCDFPLCNHWTHLIYCCKQRVVRRHDTFVCPCHASEE